MCIIPNPTESEQACTVVYNELRKAVCLVPSIKPCDDEDCVSCGIITALLADADVGAYVKSPECKDCTLTVQTAMCDNFKGRGKFAENVIKSKWALNPRYASRMRQVMFNNFVLYDLR